MKISLLKSKLGTYRVINKFLFFPKIQEGVLYWLKKVTVRQMYTNITLTGIPKWHDIVIVNEETGLPIHLKETEDKNESILETKKRFVQQGVQENKIVMTNNPSVCIWSLSKKCLVGENGIDTLEIIDCKDGNKRLTYENNVCVSLHVRTELTEKDIKEINDSEGIIITNATYGKPFFRYGFIPVEK